MPNRVGTAGDGFGPYVLERWIGGGGNADVWAASSPGGEIAIKLLRTQNSNSEPFRRFVREVTKQSELGDFPGVLPLLDSHIPTGSKKDRAWLVTPLAERLSDALSGATAQQRVGAIAAIARTLGRLDELDISHRDVKPENMFRLGAEYLLGDFGLVNAPGSEPLTETGAVVGPRFYLAPEAIAGTGGVGPSADVYMLGKSLWVVMTGQRFPPPGEHHLATDAMRISTYLLHPRAGELDVLVSAMTAHEPGARPSAQQVAAELETWASAPAVSGDHPEADLRAIVAQAAGASAGLVSDEERLTRRREEVDAAMKDFSRLAEPLVQQLEAAGAPIFRGYGTGSAFQTDASDSLVHQVGLLATTKMLGRGEPVTRALGAVVQSHDRLPSLKVWIAVSNIPPESTSLIVGGTSLMFTGSNAHQRLLNGTTKRALLGGPAVHTVMNDVVDYLAEGLAETLGEWVTAVQQASRYIDGT